jgi:BlaI family transcriptional regulator, penicillinase repressor
MNANDNNPIPTASEAADADLSELQLALMQVLWTRAEASVAEVTEALRSSRGLALTAVRRDARPLAYRAVVAPETVQRRMVGGLLSGLFGGKPSALLAHLVGQGQVSDDELQAMRALLAQAKPPAPGGTDA